MENKNNNKVDLNNNIESNIENNNEIKESNNIDEKNNDCTNDLEKKYLDDILRLKAEIDNIHKRNKNEIDKIYKFSLEKIITELLIVIDNLERTNNEFNKDKLNINIIKEGIDLTLKLFNKIITKFGVSVINDINVPFDPNIHQAISTREDKSFNNNYVINIMQKGYLLNNRLIRPAIVEVSINNEN